MGDVMDVEHKVVSLPVDNELQAEVAKLEAEGWQLVPGVVPVMVYHLVRSKVAPEEQKDKGLQSLFKMTINDDLIAVLGPDGKPKQ